MTKTALTPEVLPPAESAPAALPALRSNAVAEVLHLHQAVQDAAHQFALNTVRCGLALIGLKQTMNHGKWQAFFQEHLETQGLGLRHARNYMAVGEAFKAKAAHLGIARGALPARAAQEPDMVREILAEMTDATTWNHLWLDFGLMRKAKPLGGARERSPDTPPPPSVGEVVAERWQELAHSLHQEVFTERSHALLSHVQMRELHGLLIDAARAIKECLP